jgi:glycosyltransferase involved in cell wall biosynthesis
MKIVMTDPSLFTCRYDDSLCTALDGQGHDVALLGRPARRTDAIVPTGYRLIPRFFGKSERWRATLGDGRLFKGAKATEYWLDSQFGALGVMANADVVHMQWLPLPMADARWITRLRASGRALVHTVHNATAFHGEQGADAYARLLLRFDRLIVHGEETRAALRAQGIADDCIATIPHPPMRLTAADAHTLNDLPNPKLPRLLFFGTIRPYKGFDILIAACLDLWRRGARFELAVAGKPFMNIDALIEMVRAAGFGDRLILNLDFLREEQLDAHLQKADMVVFPYRQIDSSGAFLSALHYGKPMICTRVGMFEIARRRAAGGAVRTGECRGAGRCDPAAGRRSGTTTSDGRTGERTG